MGEQTVITERVREDGDVLKVTLKQGAEPSSLLSSLEGVFATCFKQKDYKIILDMQGIKYPSSKFIALLIEATAQARRAGGDVKLINITKTARNNLVTFSPLTYLSVESDEEYALRDFYVENTASENSAEEPSLMEEISDVCTKLEGSFTPREHRLRVRSRTDSLYEICDFVTDLATKTGMDERDIGKIKVTVYEACLNVIEHAYHSDPEQWIGVYVNYDDKKFTITIQDWGEGFKFDPSRPYDVEKAMHNRQTGGFGLHIIQRSMDDVQYESDPEMGNRLTLVKYLPGNDEIIR